MPFGTPGKFLTSIPPLQAGTTGDDMVAQVNDRFRRIAQLLGDQTPSTEAPPAAAPVSGFEYVTPTGALDNVNKVFTLPHAPNPPTSLVLRLNGVVELQGTSSHATYTLSGSTITYATPPDSNDWHFAGYSF
jgi:hypothetical protein